jgi:hypothetical protein
MTKVAHNVKTKVADWLLYEEPHWSLARLKGDLRLTLSGDY